MRLTMKWTPEMDAVIIQGVAEKLSGRQIAEKLGLATKGPVSGRARRLGIALPGKPSGRPPKQGPKPPPKPWGGHRTKGQKTRVVKPAVPKYKPKPAELPNVRRLSFAQLGPLQCRWPMSDDLYCGGTVTKYPYCDHHHLVSRRA